MPSRFGAGFLRREIHGGGEGVAGSLIEHDSVAGYVHEEGPAAPKRLPQKELSDFSQL